MASQELLDALNEAIARELQVSIQYMWQHVLARGVKGAVVGGKLKEIAVTEMKHAEDIAERLVYLGGTPTTKPSPVEVGGSVEEMLKLDVKAEEGAIQMYRGILKRAQEEGDSTTHRLFRSILADEEGHHDTFTSFLEAD